MNAIQNGRPYSKPWRLTKFKYLALVRKGRVTNEATTLPISESDVPYLSMEYLRGEVAASSYMAVTPELILAQDGDILLLWDGSNAGEFIRSKRGAVSSTIAQIIPRDNVIDRDFLFWSCKAFEKIIRAETIGMGIPHVSGESLGSLQLPLPPLVDQRRVVFDLEQELARIDALIESKESFLQLLTEKRQALITHVITRGVDSSVPLCDSGLSWAGRIPKHWRVIQFKFICSSIQTGPFGSQLHANDYVDGGIPVINPAHLINGTIVPDMRVAVDEHAAKQLSIHRLFPGDIIFARRGELGRCAVVQEYQAGWLCGTGCLRIRLKPEVVPRYMALIFEITGAAEYLALESVGSTMDNMNTEILGSFPIIFPPYDEQIAIVNGIISQITKLDSLREATEESVKLLIERRSVLIADKVLGN